METLSTLEENIIDQVEFYFGDKNLPKDFFMQRMIKVDDGWITLRTMLKFNKLASITRNPKIIVEALRKSKTGLIEIHPSENKIRRSPEKPLPKKP